MKNTTENLQILVFISMIVIIGFLVAIPATLFLNKRSEKNQEINQTIGYISGAYTSTWNQACLDNTNTITTYDRGYANGVNNALDVLMLLYLERSLQNTNSATWGELCNTVRTRLNVPVKEY